MTADGGAAELAWETANYVVGNCVVMERWMTVRLWFGTWRGQRINEERRKYGTGVF